MATTTTSQVTTHTLDVPGATLTYDIRANDTSTEPILLMIGTPMGAGGFTTLAGHFTDRTVVTYDPRGSERSVLADPDARVFKLTSPDLSHHPFIYMEHIERLTLRPAEITALRQYLLNGGVLLVNDFWGALAWQNFRAEMNRVLPGRSWTELSMEHPIRCLRRWPLGRR